jgi:hypothetical protein
MQHDVLASLHSRMVSIIANNNDTIICADQAGRIFEIRPTGQPYHVTRNASLEQWIMAVNIHNNDES